MPRNDESRSQAQPPATANPAQVRGDIQSGVTGDKKVGFDPAAAPLETDSEAGGTPLSPEMVALTRVPVAPTSDDNQGSTGSAMRPIRAKRPEGISVGVGFLLLGVLVVAALFATLLFT
jgi:hypothetical protein